VELTAKISTRTNIQNIDKALKRYLNIKIFENRILEHPMKTLNRTSIKNKNGKFKFYSKYN